MPLKDGKRERLHTFSIGIKGAPDLAAAQKVANHINSVHHEFYMTVEEGIDALQEIVYYLESYQQVILIVYSMKNTLPWKNMIRCSLCRFDLVHSNFLCYSSKETISGLAKISCAVWPSNVLLMDRSNLP